MGVQGREDGKETLKFIGKIKKVGERKWDIKKEVKMENTEKCYLIFFLSHGKWLMF